MVRRWTLAFVAVAVASLATACGGSSATPQTTLHAFLTAWSKGNWAAMRAQVADPPAAFTTANTQAFAALGVTTASFAAGTLSKTGARASAPVTERFTVPAAGTWTARTTVALVKRKGHWLVSWSPQTINPALHVGETLSLARVWPTRAAILGAGGTPLTTQQAEVDVGLVGSRIKNAAAVRADLLAAGATAAQVDQALAQAKAHPGYFDPVFTVSQARFAQLKAQPGPQNVYNVPGTQFELSKALRAITPQLQAQLVGTLGPITAQQLRKLGPPYDASSVVGQGGLEAQYERQLAGKPATQINIDDASGAPVTRLQTFPGHRGTPVRTSIDPRVQRAAEAALNGDHADVAMVAIRASTGQLLAVVSQPQTSYDQALQGAFPPGSTFKVLTSTALFARGLSPSSPASCPPTLVVDGETFHNAEGDGQASTLAEAFTESCNTAFIGLATAHLKGSDVTAAIKQYGLQRTPSLGLPAFAANVPQPTTATALAGAVIGQGADVFSPLGMASVAAAIDSGTVRAPRLVVGAPADRIATHPLPAATVANLRTMMASVVTSGTAAGTGLPPGTHAKTGTAEYGTGTPLKIDGWLMGYDGDVAFAIVTHDTPGGNDGGPVDGPLIAKFLTALGPGA